MYFLYTKFAVISQKKSAILTIKKRSFYDAKWTYKSGCQSYPHPYLTEKQ